MRRPLPCDSSRCVRRTSCRILSAKRAWLLHELVPQSSFLGALIDFWKMALMIALSVNIEKSYYRDVWHCGAKGGHYA